MGPSSEFKNMSEELLERRQRRLEGLEDWKRMLGHMRKLEALSGEEPEVLAGGTRSPAWEASRILELQKCHKALLRKNRKIEVLKDRVAALENTVKILRENRVVAHTTVTLPSGRVWAR